MCLGGGGDGGAGAQRAQEEQEQRQRRKAIRAINNQFNRPSQEAARLAFGEDVYNLNKVKLDEEQENRDRQRRFQLARQGLAGGSQDAFTRGELAEDYGEGLTGIRRHADERLLSLEADDERARSNLISQANAGLDAGTAAQLALNSATTNVGLAQNQNLYADLGQFMGDLALGAQSNAESQGRARGRRRFEDEPYSYFGQQGGGGTVTSIG